MSSKIMKFFALHTSTKHASHHSFFSAALMFMLTSAQVGCNSEGASFSEQGTQRPVSGQVEDPITPEAPVNAVQPVASVNDLSAPGSQTSPQSTPGLEVANQGDVPAQPSITMPDGQQTDGAEEGQNDVLSGNDQVDGASTLGNEVDQGMPDAGSQDLGQNDPAADLGADDIDLTQNMGDAPTEGIDMQVNDNGVPLADEFANQNPLDQTPVGQNPVDGNLDPVPNGDLNDDLIEDNAEGELALAGQGEGQDLEDIEDVRLQVEVNEVIDLCAQGGVKSKVLNIDFPSTLIGKKDSEKQKKKKRCAFKDLKVNRVLSDYKVQTISFDVDKKIGANAIICGYEFDFEPRDPYKYDDEVFLLLNDFVLMASSDYSKVDQAAVASAEPKEHAYYKGPLFVDQGSLRLIDRSNLIGQTNSSDFLSSIGAYCLGYEPQDPQSSCLLPPTQTAGKIDLRIPNRAAAELGVRLKDSKTYSFSWIATGDNDGSDCQHGGLNFDFKITYIQP